MDIRDFIKEYKQLFGTKWPQGDVQERKLLFMAENIIERQREEMVEDFVQSHFQYRDFAHHEMYFTMAYESRAFCNETYGATGEIYYGPAGPCFDFKAGELPMSVTFNMFRKQYCLSSTIFDTTNLGLEKFKNIVGGDHYSGGLDKIVYLPEQGYSELCSAYFQVYQFCDSAEEFKAHIRQCVELITDEVERIQADIRKAESGEEKKNIIVDEDDIPF